MRFTKFDKDFMKKFNGILFWTHSVVIVFAVFIGLFVSLGIFIIIISAHRIHLFLFGGCLISRLESSLNGLPKELNFLQYVSLKIFNKKISKNQSKIIDSILVILSVSIAVFI